MKIEKFETITKSVARQRAAAVGMDAADLEQEIRMRLLSREAEIDAADQSGAMARQIAVNLCKDLQRRDMRRPATFSVLTSDDCATDIWGPAEHVEREAEEATVARLQGEIDAARAAHRPLSTVRAGLRRSDWIDRLVAKDPAFPVTIIAGAVDAMQAPIPAKPDTKSWRDDAFRKGAGARIADYPRGVAARKLPKAPLVPRDYPTDDAARRSHSRAYLAKHFDPATVEVILANRDASNIGISIRAAQYEAVGKQQMRGYEDSPAGGNNPDDAEAVIL